MVSFKHPELIFSTACLPVVSQRSPLCSQSPRRLSCERPCWKRPPGTQRMRKVCRLWDVRMRNNHNTIKLQSIESIKSMQIVDWRVASAHELCWCHLGFIMLTSCFTELVVTPEEVCGCQTTADVKQEDPQLPTLWRDLLQQIQFIIR